MAPYCDENGIEYIGTLDVLTIAMNKGIFEGSALVGINEFEWSINKELPNREEISVKKNQENIFLRMIKTLRDKFRKIRIF